MSLTIQLLASLTTLLSVWAYGSKNTYGPGLALVGQVFWWVIMFQGSLWGLLPLNAAMAFIHTRNLIKWRADARRETIRAEDERASALQEHHPERPDEAADQTEPGGELR